MDTPASHSLPAQPSRPPYLGGAWIAAVSEGRAKVVVTGDFDLTNVDELRVVLSRAVADGVRDLTVDMTQLRCIDKAGISTLAPIVQLLGRGRVTLLNPPPTACRMLDVTGLASEVSIYTDPRHSDPP